MSTYRAEIPFIQRISSSNFISFKTIFYYLGVGGNHNFIISVENILGNIFAFTPLGIFITYIIYIDTKG